MLDGHPQRRMEGWITYEEKIRKDSRIIACTRYACMLACLLRVARNDRYDAR